MLTPYNISLLNHRKVNNYSEQYLIEELEYYIKEIRFNYNLQSEISNLLLSQYIKNDDKHLEKLLRKLLIIKKRNKEKSLLIYLHKWFMNTYNIFTNKDNSKNVNEINYSNKNYMLKKINNDIEKINKSNNNNNNIYKDKK